MNVKNAIYTGFPIERPLSSPTFIEGAGYVERYYMRYGMTGVAFRDTDGVWVFVPDETDIWLPVRKGHLFFPRD